VTSIGYRAFSSCSGLTAINIEESNLYYSTIDGVLYNKGKTTLIAYSGGKTGAFTAPNSVTSIGDLAFQYCRGLTSITLPNVTSIGTYAFYNCSGLTTISLPKVTSIGDRAFSFCNGLTTITLPNVTSIGDGAFISCSALTSINVDESDLYYSTLDGVLYNKGKTILIAYPKGKTGAFTAPNSVASIGAYAFLSCSGLITIELHGNVSSIESNAFYKCSGLTTIYVRSEAVADLVRKSGYAGDIEILPPNEKG
jgi:hypothetical protein